MACKERVPAPPQSIISRVETYISGIQGHRDETWNQEKRPTPNQRGEEDAAKEGGERSTQPPERCQQGTGRRTSGRTCAQGQVDMVVWLIWLCLMGGVQSYQIEYQDYRDPTRLERFMENTACAAEHTPGEQPGEKTYAVLTETPTKELAGWSCEMMKTEWRYQCEPSSQLRLATLPYIRKHVQLSVEECRNMTLHRTYRPPG
ncbi:MAG: hypothetical protein GY696_22230 [Gammaproteobacteria bacterium]|nr:hypothetical protein [Gammaproteobacteria bacterium]